MRCSVPVHPRDRLRQKARPADGRRREYSEYHLSLSTRKPYPSYAHVPTATRAHSLARTLACTLTRSHSHARSHARKPARAHARTCAGAPARARKQIRKLNAIKVALTLRKLGIDHVKGTIVGNDLVLRALARARPAHAHSVPLVVLRFARRAQRAQVRGVSGGQRKRVTTAEMLVRGVRARERRDALAAAGFSVACRMRRVASCAVLSHAARCACV